MIPSIYWLHHAGVDTLKKNEPALLESICIDKDEKVEAILRLTLNQIGIIPDESFRVHCWSTTDKQVLYFLNDLQNSYLMDKYPTACSVGDTDDSTTE